MNYKAVEQKMLREYILKSTYEMQPHPVSTDVIRKLLRSVGRNIAADTITSNVKYLEEAGYIKSKEIKMPILNQIECMISITPMGVNLVEGIIQDAALEMGE